MAAHPEVDDSLRYIRAETERLRDALRDLPAAVWDQPTSCPPWRLRHLIAHVITSGESFKLSVERGVSGLTEPAMPEDDRARRIEQASEAPPEQLIAALDRVTAEVEQLYERLDADQLEAICYHRRGNRSARWYVQHRLGEVAFHRWDVQRSLGRQAALDGEVAAFLLPMLLESNVPRIYPSGPRAEGRLRLTVEGARASSWLLSATPERLEVQRDGGRAELTITASPAVLALLVYGRANLFEQERRGRARLEGDRALAMRLRSIFPGP
jgi:uncharacterized protein (TIGR03083 family)